MVKTILVGPDLVYGEAILRTLDEGKFPITVAMWLLHKERSEDWYLVLATPLYDKLGPKGAYHELIKVLSEKAPRAVNDIRLESNQRPMIKAMRKMFGKSASVEGMRLGGQSIGGVWVDDAYVYRIR